MAVNFQAATSLSSIAGIHLASATAGFYKDRNDVVLLEIADGATTAAIFTKNAFCAAPVTLSKQHLTLASPRFLLINAGNANAGTGQAGMAAAQQSCETVAQYFNCTPEQVLPFSTGVIGQLLPATKFQPVMSTLASKLSEDHWLEAAKSIMTTDTVLKGASETVEINGRTATLTGICKGSGMINPDMATLLAFIATDAEIETNVLQDMLQSAATDSFNSITVDGDTSTNDSLVFIATGKSSITIKAENIAFQKALNKLCQHLAQMIIRDGEGATKLITIEVEQATSRDEAREVAYTIAHSPLVKTALFASDPNWGRILAAIGRSKIDALDINKVSVWLGNTALLEAGEPASDYTEEKGQIEMNKEEITIRVALARGKQSARIWTNDLSYEYIKINAEYRS
ncbi:MAG: bifunctional glutamate N-acetyltransferase/amino-acid acetyltransferase ArgJ [Thiotrichaceae bacterium]|nr:bifunctional glutamate N-acetyltransferase/amino-acid acetyltransferase ArgJ [Thiotrichaceae bacterium]